VHPFGSLEISQKLVPLNLPVQRVGTQPIADGRVFGVERVLLGTMNRPFDMQREQFAPAQFIDMSDDLKLSSRSFERYDAGIRVGGGNAASTDYVKGLELQYEVVYIPRRPKRSMFRLALFLFEAFARGGAVIRSALSAAQTGPSPIGAPRVTMASEQFAVASRVDLTRHSESMVFATEAEAHAALRAVLTTDPSLSRTLQVVPAALTRVV